MNQNLIRNQKIAILKMIMEGKYKPLANQTFTWMQREDGFYHCGNNEYEHLRFTKDQLEAFIEKNGGHHIFFESYTGNAPIIDDDSNYTAQSNDKVFVWKEGKVYEDENPTPEERSTSAAEQIPHEKHQPEKKPKRSKKKRVKESVLTRVEKSKLEANTAHQKILAQIEADNQRRSAGKEYMNMNKEFFL